MFNKYIHFLIVLLGSTVLNAQEKKEYNLFPDGVSTEKLDLGQNRDRVVINYQSPKADGTQIASIKSSVGEEKHLFNDFDYDFIITRNKDGYLVDFMSVLDPKHTRFRKGRVSRTYTGDQIFFPYSLEKDMNLPSAEGSFEIALSENLTIKQIVSLKDRKVEKEESILIDGKTYQSHVVSGVYTFTSEVSNETQERVSERIKQWFVVGKGLIKTERISILN